MNYRITHTTRYNYTEPVMICHNEARLRPLNTHNQICRKFALQISPSPLDQSDRIDFFQNNVNYFSIHQAHRYLSVQAVSEVETQAGPAGLHSCTVSWRDVAELLKTSKTQEILDARQFVLSSPLILTNQELYQYAERSFLQDRSIFESVQDLMERIYRDFLYDPNFTTIATPLSLVLKYRRGVCQDFAQLAIGCVRSMGLAARYVSGYIETLPPKDQPKLIGADASHAWFSIFVPEYGWIDFDPTNNQLAMEKHITLAIGRDFNDATPLKGVIFGGGKHNLEVSVDVTTLDSLAGGR